MVKKYLNSTQSRFSHSSSTLLRSLCYSLLFPTFSSSSCLLFFLLAAMTQHTAMMISIIRSNPEAEAAMIIIMRVISPSSSSIKPTINFSRVNCHLKGGHSIPNSLQLRLESSSVLWKSWILICTNIWKSDPILKLCIKILSFYIQKKPDHVRIYSQSNLQP